LCSQLQDIGTKPREYFDTKFNEINKDLNEIENKIPEEEKQLFTDAREKYYLAIELINLTKEHETLKTVYYILEQEYFFKSARTT